MDFLTLYTYIIQFCLSVQVGACFSFMMSLFCFKKCQYYQLCVCVFCFIQMVWALDTVTLLNPPEELLPDHRLEVLYSCDEPATVLLDCTVYFDSGITSTLLLRQWSCIPGDAKIKTLQLDLPDWLVYQADGIIPDSQWVLSCILLASVRYGGFDDTEGSVAAQDMATLQPKPFFSRPVKQHQLCLSWSSQMLQFTQQFSHKQCPVEQGKVREVSLYNAKKKANVWTTHLEFKTCNVEL